MIGEVCNEKERKREKTNFKPDFVGGYGGNHDADAGCGRGDRQYRRNHG